MMKYFSIFLLIIIARCTWAQDLQSGLIACYSFTGNANDGTNNHNDGTVHGATLTTDRFGNANSAYYFDGTTSSYISIPSGPFKINNYSYSVWTNAVSFPDNSSTGLVISVGDQVTSRHMSISLNNMFASASILGWGGGCWNDGATLTSFVAQGAIPNLNQWYHLVFTRSDSQVKFYLNGQFIGSSLTDGYPAFYGTTTNANIGVRCNYTQPFNGMIDDLSIYNRELTQQEVTLLYQNGLACSTQGSPSPDLQQGLVACYSFSGNANDGSGNQNDGTVNGATLTSDRFGNTNSAYYFDGISNFIDIPSAMLKNNNFSYSMWAYASSIPSDGSTGLTFSIGDANTSRHQSMGIGNSYANASLSGWGGGGWSNGGVACSTQTGSLPPINQWVHIVLTRNNTNYTFYLNGTLVGTCTTGNDLPYYGNNTAAHIGMRCTNIQPFNGKIDDFSIYSRELTQQEVSLLFLNGLVCAPGVAPPHVSDVAFCGPGSATITASGGVSYNWYDQPVGGNLLFQGNPFVTPVLNATTSYYVSNFDVYESKRSRVLVTVNPSPKVLCNPEEIYFHLTAKLSASVSSGTGPFSYVFDFGDGSQISVSDPQVKHDFKNGGYHDIKITVNDSKNCLSSCSMQIEILTDIIIPNVITVNSDSKNDFLNIFFKKGSGVVSYSGDEAFTLLVLDRWGKEIYRTNDSANGWNGMGVSEGTYYYLISLGQQDYRGWVSVLK